MHGRRYGRPRSRVRSARAIAISTFLIAGLAATVAPTSPVAADKGDYKLDFTAAAPLTYDHATGGGAFNDRTVGVSADIVESLQGGDFECGDIVTYLTQIRRNVEPKDLSIETLELNFSFLADTTGQSGVAMTDITYVGINYGQVSNGAGLGGTDSGITDDGGSTATLVNEGFTKPAFTKGAELFGTVRVTDLEQGERIVLRVDVRLDCNGAVPTGNLQAQLTYTDVVLSGSAGTTPVPARQRRVPGGQQTVPFKQAGDVYPMGCPERDDLSDPVNEDYCNDALAQSVNLNSVQSADTSTASGGGGRKPVVGTVTALVGTNPEVSSMFAIGALIGLVALRRKSGPSRRISQ